MKNQSNIIITFFILNLTKGNDLLTYGERAGFFFFFLFFLLCSLKHVCHIKALALSSIYFPTLETFKVQ